MNRVLIDLPEVFETKRLKFEMPRAGFGEKLHEAIVDGYEDCVTWLGWNTQLPSVLEVEEECRKHHASFILRDDIRYIILNKETGKIVGRCAFPSYQAIWRVPQFGISYFIRGSERQKGYATEAVRFMVMLAFRKLRARKVEIYCDTENLASVKVALKLGFKLEYEKTGGWLMADGSLAKLQTYAIFSEAGLPPLGVEL